MLYKAIDTKTEKTPRFRNHKLKRHSLSRQRPPQAVGFYLHYDCVQSHRSELDNAGKPYTILTLKFPENKYIIEAYLCSFSYKALFNFLKN